MTIVSSSCGSSKLRFEEIQSQILSKDIKRREFKENSGSILIIQEGKARTMQSKQKSQSRQKDDGRQQCGKKKHNRKNYWTRNENKGQNNELINMAIEAIANVLVLSMDNLMEP